MTRRLAARTSRASSNGRANGAKGVTFTPATAASWDFHSPAGTHYNYKGEVGDGLSSSVLVALLCWMMRAFPEAPAIVQRRESEKGQWREVFRHPMAEKIRQPNPFYSGRVLWMATCLDFAFGNAYWLKVRNKGGDQIKELWWMPAKLVQPIWNSRNPDVFVDHYDYSVNGRKIPLDPADVVHFRFGMDPAFPQRGFTPLNAMMREIYVDDQAANFTASILRNLGIIGIVVSPKTGENIPEVKVKETKEYMQTEVTGDKRGRGMVFSRPTDVNVLQYNLQGFDVGPIRDIAEERLSATLGIPAAVVGFGTGLQQTKVGATMKELKEMAWDGCLIPMQTIMGEELDRSLLPDFVGNERIFRTQFDTSEVRALREDEQEKSDRLAKLGTQGIITVAEVRKDLGFDAGPEHEIYYRPTIVVAVKTPGEQVEPPAPPKPKPEPAASGDSNNSGDNNNAAA